MKFEYTDVWGFEHAIRGMRQPKQSHDRIDSFYCNNDCEYCGDRGVCRIRGKPINVGTNDMKLMQTLIRAGSEHRKFMRQVFVSVDITAPMYWFSEFDTYKVGTVANSTSKMHKLASTTITRDCFELGEYIPQTTIDNLEKWRNQYNETKDKELWKVLIVNLPESWMQTRTVTMSYENLYTMVHQRKHHKLTEWSEVFITWARGLPYAQELIFLDEAEK